MHTPDIFLYKSTSGLHPCPMIAYHHDTVHATSDKHVQNQLRDDKTKLISFNLPQIYHDVDFVVCMAFWYYGYAQVSESDLLYGLEV